MSPRRLPPRGGVASTAPDARRAQHGDGEHDDVVEAMRQQQLPPPFTYQPPPPSVMGTTISPTNLPPTLPDITAVVHWPRVSDGRACSSSRRSRGHRWHRGLWRAWCRGGRGLRYSYGPNTNKGGSCYNQHTGFHRYSPFRFLPKRVRLPPTPNLGTRGKP